MLRDIAAIIPDVCTQYYYDDVIVINPLCGGRAAAVGPNSEPGPRTSCRMAIADFMTAVSASATVRGLIAAILEHQPELYLSLFESVVEMTLDAIEGVSILGPDKAIARHWNSKLVQFTELTEVVPLVKGEVCHGLDALLTRTAALRDSWPDGIFVSTAYSAAGINSAVTRSQDEVRRRFTAADSRRGGTPRRLATSSRPIPNSA